MTSFLFQKDIIKLISLGMALSLSLTHANEATSQGLWQDKKTNLIWNVCSMGQTYSGQSCKGHPQKLTFEQAIHAIRQLNAQSFAGYSDWRLPSVTEIASIRLCTSNVLREDTNKNLKISGMMITTYAPNSRNTGYRAVAISCDFNSAAPAIQQRIFHRNTTPIDAGFWTGSHTTSVKDSDQFGWGMHFGGGLIYFTSKTSPSYVRIVRGGKQQSNNN
ncbi:MAG: hypothetical protein CR974_03630 [Gammaproteobacteria bacterium]|nr:MAG: hypothetical protein CR974_03630 [Gammaproteobacteria bacterium]